ncbi:MAG: AMP nucleosidase [Geminicoccaceae bacterium]
MAKAGVRQIERFEDADGALAHIQAIYAKARANMQEALEAFTAGERRPSHVGIEAHYPYLAMHLPFARLNTDPVSAYGAAVEPGLYGTTLTRPDLFAGYYHDQIRMLIAHHRIPVHVGVSSRPIPLPFLIEEASGVFDAERMLAMQARFPMPDLARIDDAIANGTYRAAEGSLRPMALFTAERVDYSLQRLAHYTATSPRHFQGFVLLTNYQRYVDRFVDYAREEIASGDTYTAFVEPGNAVHANPRFDDEATHGTLAATLPQMPGYHLKRADGDGITLINIGVGPSNARNITDHVAVLRPHCFLMLGHCAGLRRSQELGDYVLAHAYMREDHVLDQDLPAFVPLPPIAEVQVALSNAISQITGLHGMEMKTRVRTGTVMSTDNRNWELRYAELFERLNQARAIALDMESATIAANGFRYRVPYGTLLCVSDKPLHGEIKLRGMANAFYRERVHQHLLIGLEAVRILREQGTEALHSRKLRSFDEPPFR